MVVVVALPPSPHKIFIMSSSTATGAATTISSAASSADQEDPSTFLSSLPSPLDAYAFAALPLSASSSDVTCSSSAALSARIDELEIGVRGYLLTLAGNLLRSSSSGEGGAGEVTSSKEAEEATEEVLAYLKSTIDLCVHIVSAAERLENDNGSGNNGSNDASTTTSKVPPCYRGMSHPVIRKLPFLLLEDTIDSLPPNLLKTLWSSGPTDWIIALASDPSPATTLFTRGSGLVVLKSCNKLLRKLSNRDRDAAFAGSVMTLLARVFALSERSAVNVLGTFNTTNVCEYEEEEEFEARAAMGKNGDDDGEEEDEDGDEMEVDEVANQKKKKKKALVQSSSKKEHEDKEEEDGRGSVDYPFYNTFWGVQRIFTDPSLVVGGGGSASSSAKATAATAAAAVVGAVEAEFDDKPANAFVTEIRKVLAELEGQPFPAEVARQAKNRLAASRQRPVPEKDDAASSSKSSSADRHHKYLTNSQLLHLQLRDPEMRLHFLSQLLIVTSYVSSSVASMKKTDQTAILLKSLTAVRKRAEVLMKQTPPHGHQHLKTLEWLLTDREAMWRKWKANKCQPDLELFGVAQKKPLSAEEEAEAQKRKRRRLMMGGPLGSGGASNPTESASAASELYSYRLDVKTDLPAISRKMADCVPDLSTFLEDYVEALDPENGIEAEYHPRNDKPFAWRAMRLLAKDNLGRFGEIRRKDGDFERVVRSIWKDEKDVTIPGDEPEAEQVVDFEELRAKEEAKAKAEAEAKRKREEAEAEAKRKKEEAEAEAKRKKAEAEAKRKQVEAEEKKKQQEAAAANAAKEEQDDASVGDAPSTGSPVAEDKKDASKMSKGTKKEFEDAAKEMEDEMMEDVEGASDDKVKKEEKPAAAEEKKDSEKPKENGGKGKKFTPAKKTEENKSGGGVRGGGRRGKRKADDMSKDDTGKDNDAKSQDTKKAKTNDGGGKGSGGDRNRSNSPKPDGNNNRGGGGGTRGQQRGGQQQPDNRRGGGGGRNSRGSADSRGHANDGPRGGGGGGVGGGGGGPRGRDDRGRGNDGPRGGGGPGGPGGGGRDWDRGRSGGDGGRRHSGGGGGAGGGRRGRR